MNRFITRWIIEFALLTIIFIVIESISATMILSTILHYAWCIIVCTIFLREEMKVVKYLEKRSNETPKYYIEYDNALCPIDSIDDE